MVHTLAAILHRLNEPLEIEELTVPELLAGQVLVRLAFSGVCHTQVLEARGKRGPDRFLPHAMGHEASGTVISVGPSVTQVKVGDQVMLSWMLGSGSEAPGPKYRASAGHYVNAGPIATFTQLAVVSENRCTRRLGLLSSQAAAVLGCAVATGLGLVDNHLEEVAGSTVVVFGAGGIGLSALWAARDRGASRVIAVDPRESARELALELGATEALVPEEVEEKARGVEYALDASGVVGAMEAAFRIVKDRGGKVVIAGNPPVGESVRIDPYGLIRGKRIEGSVGGGCRPNRDFPAFERRLAERKFPFEKFLGKSYPLARVNDALDDLERGTSGRLVIEF